MSVEFDPFGFSVKDFHTWILLMRCNSSGDLYPIATKSPNKALPPSTFVVLSTELWHNHLRHPWVTILISLHWDNFLQCNKSLNNYFCNSCPLYKQIKLPFIAICLIPLCLLILCTVTFRLQQLLVQKVIVTMCYFLTITQKIYGLF